MSGPGQTRHGLPGAAPGGACLVVRRETASQTAGPYVHIGLAPQPPASTSSRTTSATC